MGMKRYFLEIAYNGTSFHGWQIQPNAVTVQGTLNQVLQTFLRVPELETMGCGRTDAGVHAKYFVLHFDLADPIPENLVYRINQMLDPAIAVKAITEVDANAHARFDATLRTYEYHFHQRKNPFKDNLSTYLFGDLDVDAMQQAANALFDFEDFTSFSKLHTDVKTNRCKIFTAQWKQDGDSLCFTISADRFLRNMVRAIVGTLIQVGKGKLSVEGFRAIIEQQDSRSSWNIGTGYRTLSNRCKIPLSFGP